MLTTKNLSPFFSSSSSPLLGVSAFIAHCCCHHHRLLVPSSHLSSHLDLSSLVQSLSWISIRLHIPTSTPFLFHPQSLSISSSDKNAQQERHSISSFHSEILLLWRTRWLTSKYTSLRPLGPFFAGYSLQSSDFYQISCYRQSLLKDLTFNSVNTFHLSLIVTSDKVNFEC